MSENFQELIKDINTKLDYSLHAKDYQKALQQIENLIQFHQLNNSLTYQIIFQKAQLNFENKMFKQCFENCLLAQQMFNRNMKEKSDKSQQNKTEAQKISFLMMRSLLQEGQIQMAKKQLNTFLENRDNYSELLRLSTAINRLQKHNPYVLSPQQQSILAEMKTWLYKVGSQYDKLKVIKLGQNYRGVIATKQIKRGQRIVFVPYSHIITLQMAKKTPLAKKILQKKIELLSPKHTLLSILLLEEKKKTNSKWKLYLDLLPENHSSFPINYQKQELMELVGSNFLFQIREKVLDLKKDYETLINLDADFANQFNFKAFCWARTIIGSRIFGLVIDSVKTQVLVPFADMLNHKVPKQTVWNYSDQLNGFIIQSLEDIMPGQQVFDSYGKKCNSRFLLNYGFVIPDNTQNQISLKLSISENDQLLSRKLEMLKQTTPLSKVYKISMSMEDNNFYELMGYLRFHQVSDAQTILLLEKISGIRQNNTAYRPSKTPPINIGLQIKVWNVLHQICKENLQSYSTTIEQDEKLIKQHKSQNMQNIIILRLGEKKILRFYIETSLKIIELLQKGRKQAKQYAQKHQQQPFSSYLNKILPIMLPNKQRKIKNKSQESIQPDQKDE